MTSLDLMSQDIDSNQDEFYHVCDNDSDNEEENQSIYEPHAEIDTPQAEACHEVTFGSKSTEEDDRYAEQTELDVSQYPDNQPRESDHSGSNPSWDSGIYPQHGAPGEETNPSVPFVKQHVHTHPAHRLVSRTEGHLWSSASFSSQCQICAQVMGQKRNGSPTTSDYTHNSPNGVLNRPTRTGLQNNMASNPVLLRSESQTTLDRRKIDPTSPVRGRMSLANAVPPMRPLSTRSVSMTLPLKSFGVSRDTNPDGWHSMQNLVPISENSASTNMVYSSDNRKVSEGSQFFPFADGTDQNGYQHCIVCRTCSTQANQIRPGRHFVLSWKQIFILIIILIVYVTGGAFLFVELERPAEANRQRMFIVLFQDFLANHSCVRSKDLFEFTSAVLSDSKLAWLLLEDYVEKGCSSNSSISNQGDRNFTAVGNVSSRRQITSINVNNWPLIWEIKNSLGFVISALTTIGYGHLAPKTAAGRLVFVLYGVIGIPLTLLFLGGLGEKMRRLTSRFIMRKALFPFSKLTNQVVNCTLLGGVGILLLFVGPSIALTHVEGWPVADAVYYCFVSLSTIGFGDMVLGDPTAKSTRNQNAGHYIYRVMSLIWVLFGLAYVGMVITSLAHLIIRGSCGAYNKETMRLKAELKRLKHEIRAQRLYAKRNGLSMWTSQFADSESRWGSQASLAVDDRRKF